MQKNYGRSRGWDPAHRGRSSGLWRSSRESSSLYQAFRPVPERAQSPPLGSLRMLINRQDLEDSKTDDNALSISGCETVSSYSWLDKNEPVILVPGRPPAWTPPAIAEKLKEDSGKYFRDPNAARYPTNPMEPAVRAIFASQPDFPTTTVDIFGCSSTIGNLLRFVNGEEKPFRILLHVIGDSVFFVRRENSPTELIPDVRGFGHTFPEAYTSWDPDVKGSVSHQRIIRYNFDGLSCVVRFGADGYLRDKVPGNSKNGKSPEPIASDLSYDALSSTLATSSVSEATNSAASSLAIEDGGKLLPQSAIFELKTRSFRKKDQDVVAQEMPRLWVTQVQNFILAYHESGFFDDIQKTNVSQNVQEWEGRNQDMLHKFSALLHKIVRVARSTDEHRLELRCRAGGILEVRESLPEAAHALSAASQARWLQTRDCSETESEERLGSLYDDDYSGDDEKDLDFTACSAEDCGYCGRCTY